MLRSHVCDSSDVSINVNGTITVTNPDNNTYDKKLAFKNDAPFVSPISKINSTSIDNVEDLDIVMPVYNLIEYRKQIIQKQQKDFGITTEMNQIVV